MRLPFPNFQPQSVVMKGSTRGHQRPNEEREPTGRRILRKDKIIPNLAEISNKIMALESVYCVLFGDG